MKHRPLCAEPSADPSLWFAGPEAAGHAKAICSQCPAADECLEQALAWHPMEGIWGGTTIGDRRRIRKQRAARASGALVAAGARP